MKAVGTQWPPRLPENEQDVGAADVQGEGCSLAYSEGSKVSNPALAPQRSLKMWLRDGDTSEGFPTSESGFTFKEKQRLFPGKQSGPWLFHLLTSIGGCV